VNFSYNWLKELVPDLDLDARSLEEAITLRTAECEGIHAYAAHLASVFAVRVTQVEPIEGGKNVKAVVDGGARGTARVVCGAPNCRPGVVTAYVPAGTQIAQRTITKASIGGIESEGMLASGAELGVNRDSVGILELAGVEPGLPIGLQPDHIIEVDNKSLTHRPDLWGHHGLAREVAAITRNRLLDPVDLSVLPSPGEAPVRVAIDDYSLCPRYSALVFENVTVQPSPLWLQYRLEAIGLNPINNIVDVTNYVMSEIAQPMHAFDADKVEGAIVVRSGRGGERCQALNGELYEVTTANLLITDDSGPIAIAGVIGGLGSAISESTTRIVLESANFHPGSVRRTSSALRLRTDASMRFEKAQDPSNTVRGLARAVTLLAEVSPGIRIVGGLVDVGGDRRKLPVIDLPLDWLGRKLGKQVPAVDVRAILEALEFGVAQPHPGALRVSVPSWRATKDISIKDDLVEEVGRMIGYSSIPPQAPMLPAAVPPPNPERRCQHGVRRLLTARGFHEVYNYSFLSDESARAFGFDDQALVRVTNPIAADQSLLRPSLVPGICKNINDNARFLDEFRFFEIGVEIHRTGANLVPDELTRVAISAYNKGTVWEPIYACKDAALAISGGMQVRSSTEVRVFEHPARTGDLLLDGVVVGRLFEFHPRFVERGRGAVAELDLKALMRLGRGEMRYTPIRRFPSSAFDLSVVAPARATVQDLQHALRTLAGATLDSIDYVRQYSGPPLPEGHKSVSYRLSVSAPDRTLSSDEVAAIRNRIIEGMRAQGYDLRV
jgi:phenylalanyl-tRNA synthetase beta chain